MNPLANIEFNQNNLDAIAGALEGKPRSEVYRVLKHKFSENKCISFPSAARLDSKYDCYKTATIIMAVASVLLAVRFSLWGACHVSTVSLASVAGLGLATLTAAVIMSVLYLKYAKQGMPKEEIKQKLHNAMAAMYHQREAWKHNGENRWVSEVEKALETYFGNEQPIKLTNQEGI